MILRYLNSRVWPLKGSIMLVYFRTGNKRRITRMKVQVSKDRHYCYRCPYNTECKRVCSDLEEMDKLREEVKKEFGIGSCLLHITPLKIEILRAKWTPKF